MVLAGKKPYFRAAIKKTSCPLCHTSNLSIINIPTPSSLSIINIPTPIRQIQSAPWRHPDVAAQPRRWHRHPSERASAHQPQSKSCKPTKTKYKKPCASPTTYTCDPTWKQNNIQYQVSSIPINTPTAKKQLPSIEGRSCPQGACCGSAQGNGANTCWFCWCYTYMHVYIHIYNILYVYILEDPLHLSYIYIYFTTWPIMSLFKSDIQPGFNRHNTNPPRTTPGLILPYHRNLVLRAVEPCVDHILQKDVVRALSRARHDGWAKSLRPLMAGEWNAIISRPSRSQSQSPYDNINIYIYT